MPDFTLGEWLAILTGLATVIGGICWCSAMFIRVGRILQMLENMKGQVRDHSDEIDLIDRRVAHLEGQLT